MINNRNLIIRVYSILTQLMFEEDKPTVRNIALGLYTKWRMDRPKPLERIIDNFSLQAVDKSYNDTEMTVDTGNTMTNITTYRDRVIIHSIEFKNSNNKVEIEEVFKLQEYKNRKSYADDFVKKWHQSIES